MNKGDKLVTCYICGQKFVGGSLDDCPMCDWTYLGWESEMDPDDKDTANPLSIRQAKENVKKGLDIWGNPLPHNIK